VWRCTAERWRLGGDTRLGRTEKKRVERKKHDCKGVFGCEKKIRREKEVRESKGREKEVRNRVDLSYCLV
jgi:hypothetical protein